MPTNAIFDPEIFDGPLMFDTRQKNFSVTIFDEGGAVSDLLQKQVDYHREFLEGGKPIFDGAIFDDLIFDTSASGSGRITDNLNARKSFFATITEPSISINDSLERMLKAFRNLPETVLISDSLSRLVKYYREIIDAGQGIFDGPLMFDPEIFDVNVGGIRISDTISAIRGAKVSLLETVTSTDDLARKLKAFVNLSENTTINDILTAKSNFFISLLETVTSSDNLERTLKAFRSLSDTSIISDLLESVRGAKVSLLENVLVTDSLARLSKHYRSLTDSIIITDTLTAFKVVGRRIKHAVAWINKRSANAFIFKRKTTADANKRKTNASV